MFYRGERRRSDAVIPSLPQCDRIRVETAWVVSLVIPAPLASLPPNKRFLLSRASG